MRKQKIPTIILAALLSACAHPGTGSSSLPSHPGWTPTRATMRVLMPPGWHPRKHADARITPHFIGGSTQSVSFTLTAYNGSSVTPQTVTVALTTSDCTGGPNWVCTATSTEPVGSDTFDVSTYASANGSGTPLSTNTVTATIASAGSNVSVTLNPVVSQVAFSPTAATALDGTASSGSVVLNVEDAAGDILIGSAPYVTPTNAADPITLSCQSHLSPINSQGANMASSITSPSSTYPLASVNYDGFDFGSGGGTQTCSAADTVQGLSATFTLTLSSSGSVTWSIN
jgi:hypothetical protein